jgi:3D (Asp-Asp-Asp) domain-containing protein
MKFKCFLAVLLCLLTAPLSASATSEMADPVLHAQIEAVKNHVLFLSGEAEAMHAEIRFILDLYILNRFFNTQELLAGFERGGHVTAAQLMQSNRAYRRPPLADLQRRYGDIFGRQFTASTTAYVIYGYTRSGRLTRGGTVAVDTGVIPLGTRMLSLNFNRVFRADDTGGDIRGNTIDVFLHDTAANARQWGRRNTDWIILDNQKIREQRLQSTEVVAAYTQDAEEAARLLAMGRSETIRAMVALYAYPLSVEAESRITEIFLLDTE